MPKFHINFRHRDRIVIDGVGVELVGLEEARQAALHSARGLLAYCVRWGSSRPMEAVVITDESGRALMTIRATEVLPEPLKR
jgi:hypothetical protein